MSLNIKTFILTICCSVIFLHSLVYGQQPSSAAVDYDVELNKLCEQLSSDPYNAELYMKLKVILGKLPDINEQCRCAAIYYLAVSIAGNSDEASKSIRFIKKKNPNSEYLQRLSGNNLSKNCPNCNGKGTITSKCKTCGGSGKCSMCKGRGSLEGIGGKNRTCSCRGSGKCKQCAGTGNTTLKCQKCRGKGKILSSQSIKNEYLALLNEKRSKQSNIAVATGQDAKNEQKESDQQQTQSSSDSKSTGSLVKKTENDCEQQYGKSLKRTVLDDGYVEAIYEKNKITIKIIFNRDGYIDYISYLSNEPFTEEQRKVLIEKYSINQEEWINHPMASFYLLPKSIKSGSQVDMAINQAVLNMIRRPTTPYGVWVRSDNDEFIGMWERIDGAEAFYYKKDGYILKIQSVNYKEWVKKEQEKREIEEKQKERSKVDGL